MDQKKLWDMILNGIKPDVCKHWKDWSDKEKRRWIITLLVSGADYAGDIERERLGICFDCYFDRHGNCFKEGETKHDDRICHCFKGKCRRSTV